MVKPHAVALQLAASKSLVLTNLVRPSCIGRGLQLTCQHRLRSPLPRRRYLSVAPNPHLVHAKRDLGNNFQVTEDKNGRYLSYVAGNAKTAPLDLVFLRDSCTCARCVNVASSQKQFETSDIPLSIDVKAVKALQNGDTQIVWANDVVGYGEHSTILPSEFLQHNATVSQRLENAFEKDDVMPWSKKSLSEKEAEIRYDYAEYMASDLTLHSLLKSLSRYGLAFIHNVPRDESSVISISQRIGPVQNTFYGQSWDVRARPSAKNVAYTANFLGFHMDLLYMKDPPSLQFLHCLKQSTEGGESLFSDALNAVYDIQQRHPKLAPVMWQFPVTYRYRNNGKYYQYTRPLLEGQGMGDADQVFERWLDSEHTGREENLSSRKAGLIWNRHFHAVNWSPPFQGQLLWDVGQQTTGVANASQLRDYVKISQLFRNVIEDPGNVFETKMDEGTCVVFDNRRVVHARRAFTAEGGERWLKGCYVDVNSFRSRLRSFEAGFHDEAPTVLGD